MENEWLRRTSHRRAKQLKHQRARKIMTNSVCWWLLNGTLSITRRVSSQVERRVEKQWLEWFVPYNFSIDERALRLLASCASADVYPFILLFYFTQLRKLHWNHFEERGLLLTEILRYARVFVNPLLYCVMLRIRKTRRKAKWKLSMHLFLRLPQITT